MNKNELSAAIAAKAGLTRKDAEAALCAMSDIIAESLKNGEKVQIVGFGAFEVKERPARKARNPKTGEDIPIPANQYLNNNITFYYYDADYVTSENTMLATISRIERYIDLNDDGVVNGTINQVTGEFVPADGESVYDTGTNTGTYYVLPSLTDSAYSISQLAPRLGADGKYHQIVLKV